MLRDYKLWTLVVFLFAFLDFAITTYSITTRFAGDFNQETNPVMRLFFQLVFFPAVLGIISWFTIVLCAGWLVMRYYEPLPSRDLSLLAVWAFPLAYHGAFIFNWFNWLVWH